MTSDVLLMFKVKWSKRSRSQCENVVWLPSYCCFVGNRGRWIQWRCQNFYLNLWNSSSNACAVKIWGDHRGTTCTASSGCQVAMHSHCHVLELFCICHRIGLEHLRLQVIGEFILLWYWYMNDLYSYLFHDYSLLMQLVATGYRLCTDEEAGLRQHADSKRFMRFGRQQPQQPVDDDTDGISRMADTREPSMADKRFMRFGREFMRFGRDLRRECDLGEADC